MRQNAPEGELLLEPETDVLTAEWASIDAEIDSLHLRCLDPVDDAVVDLLRVAYPEAGRNGQEVLPSDDAALNHNGVLGDLRHAVPAIFDLASDPPSWREPDEPACRGDVRVTLAKTDMGFVWGVGILEVELLSMQEWDADPSGYACTQVVEGAHA